MSGPKEIRWWQALERQLGSESLSWEQQWIFIHRTRPTGKVMRGKAAYFLFLSRWQHLIPLTNSHKSYSIHSFLHSGCVSIVQHTAAYCGIQLPDPHRTESFVHVAEILARKPGFVVRAMRAAVLFRTPLSRLTRREVLQPIVLRSARSAWYQVERMETEEGFW